MSQNPVFFPNPPLYLAHRAWRPPREDTPISESAGSSEDSSWSLAADQTNRANAIDEPRPAKTATPTNRFQFVNTTEPSHFRTAETKRLVKSHVMKGLHRDRNRRKASKAKPVSDASKPTQLDVIHAPKLGTACPGSTMAFYGHEAAFSLAGKDSGLQSLLEYCTLIPK
jgi:hypothetical protein